jgi:poly-gamma-glutamate synthesis protein (capsule biosynthesis protein)
METYKGVPIYYSIGNFIFDQKKPINTRAAVVTLAISKDTAVFDVLPVEIVECVPRLVEE